MADPGFPADGWGKGWPSTYYYRPQRSWGKVMFLQVCVILFTGGVPDQVHPLGPGIPPRPAAPPGPGTHPRPGAPLTRYTPPDQMHPPDQVHPRTRYTPWTRYTPQDQVHPPDQVHLPDQVRPPPEPGRYGLRAGGTHPTGMHSCLAKFLLKTA